MRHTLTIPGYIPCGVNELLRVHWSKRRRLKLECRELVGHYSREQGIPRAEGKRRVSLSFTLSGRGKVKDDDNVRKVLSDALVAAGLLVDDAPAWVEWGPVTWGRGAARGTVVVLEDLP